MGYYMRGDYYQRGDYYKRGDFWSGLGHVIKGGIDVVTGNFGGAIQEGAALFGPSKPSTPGIPKPPSGGIQFPAGGGISTPFGNFGTLKNPPVGANGVPSGYHISKKTGKLVRNRHMNVANVRALSRAARRAHGFLKMSKRFIKYYTPKAHKGHAYIGAKRKRSR